MIIKSSDVGVDTDYINLRISAMTRARPVSEHPSDVVEENRILGNKAIAAAVAVLRAAE